MIIHRDMRGLMCHIVGAIILLSIRRVGHGIHSSSTSDEGNHPPHSPPPQHDHKELFPPPSLVGPPPYPNHTHVNRPPSPRQSNHPPSHTPIVSPLDRMARTGEICL